MRQIFSSKRLENVEGVVKLLNEAGIETYVSNARSYKGARRREFSYRDSDEDEPAAAVWIVKAEDITPARQILADQGLLLPDVSIGSYLPADVRDEVIASQQPKSRWTPMRLRLILLAVIAVLVALMYATNVFKV